MQKSLFIRKSTIFFVLFILLFTVNAKDTKDYSQLSESATPAEIQAEFKKLPGLKTQTFGTNKETLLMIALRNNRDIEIINTLIKNGCSLDAKSKDKRTPIMFASRFSTNQDVVELILNTGTLTKNAKKKRLLATDKTGKNSFDYAKQNSSSEIYTYLCSITEDPGIQKTQSESESIDEADNKNEINSEGSTSQTSSKTKKGMHTVTTTYSAPKKETSEELKTQPSIASEEQINTDSSIIQPIVEDSEKAVESVASTITGTSVTATGAEITSSAIIAPVQIATSTVTKPTTIENNENEKITTSSIKEEPSVEESVEEKSYLNAYINKSTHQDTETISQSNKDNSLFFIDDVNKTDKNGVTLLMKAAKAGNDWDVQNLLNLGADVQLRDKDGWSALMYAVRYQNSIMIVNMLIEKGAHTRIRNKYNSTPLLLAANYSQNPQILSLLLRNRSASEEEVFKAFILTITSNEGADHIQKTKIQLFIDMGLSVNRSWKGKTPLMYAAQYGNSTAVIDQLLHSGAKPSETNIKGQRAFDFAKENTKLPHDDIYWSLNSSKE